MKKADLISYKLIDWLGFKYKSDLFITNTYLDRYEMDVMRLNQKGMVTEYEIKISKADFKNDAKKGGNFFGKMTTKYGKYEEGKSKCNRFYYVVPKDLISVSELPKFAGLIYFYEDTNKFEIVKNAPLMHKRKHFKTELDYIKLAIKCNHREMGWKQKYHNLKNKLNDPKPKPKRRKK